ncbi:hypothetical protein JCM8097_001847 [Rhodosporidiobolus ruineniae]
MQLFTLPLSLVFIPLAVAGTAHAAIVKPRQVTSSKLGAKWRDSPLYLSTKQYECPSYTADVYGLAETEPFTLDIVDANNRSVLVPLGGGFPAGPVEYHPELPSQSNISMRVTNARGEVGFSDPVLVENPNDYSGCVLRPGQKSDFAASFGRTSKIIGGSIGGAGGMLFLALVYFGAVRPRMRDRRYRRERERALRADCERVGAAVPLENRAAAEAAVATTTTGSPNKSAAAPDVLGLSRQNTDDVAFSPRPPSYRTA